MKNYDVKHIVYHTLIAIYFIWLAVFSVLLVLALINYYNGFNLQLTKILLTWIFVNFFMGTALVIVIQQFRRHTVLSRIILYAYFLMATASLTAVLVILQ